MKKENKYMILAILIYIILNISIHVDFLKEYDFLSYTNSLFSYILIIKLTNIKIKEIKNKNNVIIFNSLLLITIIHFVYLVYKLYY